MNRLRRTILVIAAIAGCAVWLAVPAARRRPGAGSGSATCAFRAAAGGDGARRRRVDRPSAHDGCRVRHPAERRQRVRCRRRLAHRRRRPRTGPVQPRRGSAGAGLPEERGEGPLGRRPGLGAERGQRRLVSVAKEESGRRGARPGGGPRRAARRAHGAREVGHDELRRGRGARHRVRRERIPAAAEHGANDREPS